MVLRVYDCRTFAQSGYSVPDVYFSAQYGWAEEAAGAGRWLILEAYDARWLLPVHVRQGAIASDAVSPYGYAGFYSASDLDDRSARAAWREAQVALRELGCVSLFVRQSPLVTRGWAGPEGEEVVSGHPTVQLRVSDASIAWHGMAGRARTSVRKAQKQGMTAAVRQATPRCVARGSAFRELYENGMRRRQAAERYHFPDDYYSRLLEGLGQNLLVAEVVDSTGGVVASSLLLRHGRQLHYHLSGSDVDAGRQGATNALIWAAMEWAGHAGIDAFHLGGGLASGDSLEKFKASFGGSMLAYDAYGVVLDHQSYNRATSQRARELGIDPAELDQRRGMFPKFRSTG